MSPYFWLDFFASLTMLSLGGLYWYRHHKEQRQERITWKFVRYYGGGGFTAPHPMTLREATKYIGQECNAEVGHIDRECGFIFYRPRGH
jgi:hypothetical protein